MTTIQPNGIKARLLTLAARPEGVTSKDLSSLSSNSVGTAAWVMTQRGELFAIRDGRANRWFLTKEARDKYAAKIHKQAPKLSQAYVISQPAVVIRGNKAWDKNTEPHYPTDAKGRPLYKVTICPGFTGQPTKTNTHLVAY